MTIIQIEKSYLRLIQPFKNLKSINPPINNPLIKYNKGLLSDLSR